MTRLTTLALIALATAGAAHADTLDMDGMDAMNGTDRPTRGMTQARVESKYGSPDDKIAAVGEPPISRWVYRDFIVYFEYDKVVHAVVKR